MSLNARESRQTNPTSDNRRAVFLFRTATGVGAAAAALRLPSHGLSVRVSPSYRGQFSSARASDEAFGSIHSDSLTILGSTNDIRDERTLSSDLDGVRGRGTPPRPRSSSAACYLRGRNNTRRHKEQMMNRERRVQEKREKLLTPIFNGEQAL